MKLQLSLSYAIARRDSTKTYEGGRQKSHYQCWGSTFTSLVSFVCLDLTKRSPP